MVSTQDPLNSVPADIIIEVISWLDPVSLIAFSQTSKTFRNFIRPVDHDFQQRLLALELLPKYGGPDRDIEAGAKHVGLDGRMYREHDWWANNKYACCGCMKILSRSMFEDDELFGATKRKPWAISAETQKTAFTDWKFTSTTESRLCLIEKQAVRNAQDMGYHEMQYILANSWLSSLNLQQLLDNTQNETDSSKAEIAEHKKSFQETAQFIIGTARHERRCIECKFQQGLYSDPTQFLCGNPRAPITTFSDSNSAIEIDFTWLFPGLFSKVPRPVDYEMDLTHWDFVDQGTLNVHIVDPDSRILRIRCPGCEKWQRARAFGITVVDLGWSPEVHAEVAAQWIDPKLFPNNMALQLDQTSPLCHYCHFKAHGKSATAARLCSAALDVINAQNRKHLQETELEWSSVLCMIQALLVETDQKETWDKVAIHSDNGPLDEDLDWRHYVPSAPGTKLFNSPNERHLSTLEARRHLINTALAKFWKDLDEGKVSIPIPDGSDDAFNMVRDFLENPCEGVEHQTTMNMCLARDKIIEAKSAGNHDSLLASLMPQDEYGRELSE